MVFISYRLDLYYHHLSLAVTKLVGCALLWCCANKREQRNETNRRPEFLSDRVDLRYDSFHSAF